MTKKVLTTESVISSMAANTAGPLRPARLVGGIVDQPSSNVISSRLNTVAKIAAAAFSLNTAGCPVSTQIRRLPNV